MKIVGARTYLGPNLMADVPAVVLRVQLGGAQGRSTDGLTQVVDGIVALLPSLADDVGDAGEPGGLIAGFRAPPGQPLTKLMARVALELQRQVGADVHVWGELTTGDRATRDIVFAYEDVEVGHVAGDHALALVNALLPTDLRDDGSAPPAEPASILNRFLQWAHPRALDQSTRALVNAARRRGIPWFRIHPSARLVQLGQGVHQHRLHETLLSDASTIATYIARDKTMTNHLLQVGGVPAPQQIAFADAETAVRGAERLGYPVVVKPAGGAKGQAVAVRLTTTDSVRAAAAHVIRSGSPGVVESFVPGDDHRLLVVGGRMIAAARRIPGHVVGDGQQTIASLVDELNRDPRRGTGYSKLMNRIEWDGQADLMLRERGYTRQTVPAKGEVVFLRRTANISTGGTAVDATATVHPDNRRLVERAAALVGLPVAGIDVLSPDISRSYQDVPVAVCEANAAPGLRPHWIANPDQDVVGPILDVMFPGDSQGRIPIAAVTGTNGKTTTVVMLSRILQQAGHVVGWATSDAAWVNDDRVLAEEASYINGARAILRDPRVEMAVLEVARQGLLNQGVGFDECTVAAVTNIDDDHIGDRGIDSLDDMARVKQVVARLARDTVVLNADDARCRAMAESCPAAHVCLVTLRPQQAGLVEHLQGGGRAIWLDNAGQIMLHDGSGIERLLAARDIPATLDGLVTHNIANAMFAAAMARALEVSVEDIRTALMAFESTAKTNPGRLNIYDGHPFRVIVDYAHNAPGAARMRALVERLHPEGKRILVFYSYGNRADDKIALLGRTVAGGFDHYLCYQPDDLRGRPAGVVNDLLQTALANAGVDADKISAWPSEPEAVAAALDLAQPGDLVTVFSAAYARTWRQVVDYAAPDAGADDDGG